MRESRCLEEGATDSRAMSDGERTNAFQTGDEVEEHSAVGEEVRFELDERAAFRPG